MTLIVCSLAALPDAIAARRPSHVISLLDPELSIDVAEGMAEANHLRLGVHDVILEAPGVVAPSAALVARAINFARAWDRRAPMIIHCLAGVSRSTATALAVACDHNPGAPEIDIALALRRAAPHAVPNKRIVTLADAYLNRGGRLIAAAQAMGPENMAAYCVPFDLPSTYPLAAGPA